MSYKAGDYYPDWESLKRLPGNRSKMNQEIKEGDLFVLVADKEETSREVARCRYGTVLELTKDDNTSSPYFTCGGSNDKNCVSLTRIAILPKSLTKKDMANKLTAWAKRTFSPKQKKLFKAGLITNCCEPTTEGKQELDAIVWSKFEDDLVKVAEEILSDDKQEEGK